MTSILIADPPWRFKNWSDTSRGAQQAHYPGMEWFAMKTLEPLVSGLAGPDSVMLMWCCWPKIDEGVDLCRAWRYEEVTGFPWVKTVPDSGTIRRGIGFWAQSASEFVLVRRRGAIRREKLEEQVIGLLCGAERQFYHPIQKHSRKPYCLHEWAEEMFPDARKVELFATEERDGWECYGHRCGTHLAPHGILTIEEAKQQKLLPEDYDPWAEPVTQRARKRAAKGETLPVQRSLFGA